ncbi:transketolase [Candidatus Woesearchaeota archaeon]|nr:MAG: transketolase [Candidatus Woesearchaeota archaeon]
MGEESGSAASVVSIPDDEQFDVTKEYSDKELALIANTVRKDIVRMLAEAKSGHSGGSLGLADIFTVLYFRVMKHKPSDPFWPERDIFILSNGHVVPVRYAVMARAGYLPVKELLTLRKLGTRLQGHPHRGDLPGLETSAGSLGQGLSIAVGAAYGLKMDGKPNTVFCSMGDGELQEGSIWEAAMAAGHYKLDNLIGFVDRNMLQIDGNTEDVMKLEPLADKWKSFNWEVIEANGHSIKEITEAFEKAKAVKGKPAVILFHTKMGKGVSFMEDKAEWHGKPPSIDEMKKALEELQETEEKIKAGEVM